MEPKLTEWNVRFLKLAQHIAQWSKDPSTKVGCVIVGPDKEIRSTGFNGFPRGIADNWRLEDRELKYPLICHAEENAIMHAARIGVSIKGCVMYITHQPCCRCARAMIQAGIKQMIYLSNQENKLPDNWKKDIENAEHMMREADLLFFGVEIL